MPHVYKLRWTDHEGKRAFNTFFAANLADATTIAEDLADICASSWVEMREDSLLVTPTSTRYQQPATTAATVHQVAVMSMRAGAARTLHKLNLHSVIPSYVNRATRRTTTSPFRNLALLLTSEGEAFGEFTEARYKYQSREPSA